MWKVYLTDAAVHGTGNALANLIVGNDNNNMIWGLGGDDWLNGGGGNDNIDGGDGSDELDGGTGADVMWGGAGNDDFMVDNLGDVVHGGIGSDQVWSSVDFWLPVDAEELHLLSGPAVIGFGNDSNNLIWGNENNNILSGFGGTDTIRGYGGDDTIDGGAGLDVLIGGTGRDILSGGAGLDFFVFNDAAETGLTEGTADVITDFNIAEGDRINLGLVDADAYADGNQAFTFIGMAAFSGTPGEVRDCLFVGPRPYRASGRGAVDDGQFVEAAGEAVPLAHALHVGRLRGHEALDRAALAEHRRHFAAGAVVVLVTTLHLVDVLLQIVEELLDVDLAIRPAQNRVLQFAVELILEPITIVVDALEQILDLRIGQAGGRRRWGDVSKDSSTATAIVVMGESPPGMLRPATSSGL